MQTNQLTVVVIDDSDIIRKRLAEMLFEIEGVKGVSEAACAQEGLEQVHSLKPDLVVLDLKMPNKNGFHIIKRIKEGKPSPVVAILTNYPFSSYRKRCMKLGADYFFDKSSEFGKVRDIVMDLMTVRTGASGLFRGRLRCD